MKPGWSKPHIHSNPANLALFRHKITLYTFNQVGLILLQGGSNGSRGRGWAPPLWTPPPLTLTTGTRASLLHRQRRLSRYSRGRAMKITFPDKDYCRLSSPALTRSSHDESSWLSGSSVGAFYGNRPVYTTCCRTNGTQPSQTDYVMRKHLHHSPMETEKFRKTFIPHCLNLYD